MSKYDKKFENIQIREELISNYKSANIGLEKESLRINSSGISQEIHPKPLGSSLTNQFLTTDFSEALLEFITPPYDIRGNELVFLEDLHHFSHLNIEDEKLWPFSIAPNTKDLDIAIAKYGNSNLGKFKELYRSGLAKRHGKAMQIIAGVHFNYSFSNSYIERYKEIENKISNTDEVYLKTIRNIYRNNWLLLLLFGSSPIVSNNLLKKNEIDSLAIDEEYSYFPYATSLRMSDLGYQNTVNEFNVSLDSVEKYTDSLIKATNEICESFSHIDSNSQISPNILQIEDEYYSAARPKSSISSDERLAKKLIKHGIQYIELRSIDIEPFEPIGISLNTILFLEVFMVFCSLIKSPNICANEFKTIKQNNILVSRYGRSNNIKLNKDNEELDIKLLASDILSEMLVLSELMETERLSYVDAVKEKIQQINNPLFLPSSKFLERFFVSNSSYFDFGNNIADRNRIKFISKDYQANKHHNLLENEALQSISSIEEIENNEHITLEDYIQKYFEL